MSYRTERDSLGEVQVPSNVYWGAQTERSLHFFNIGQDRMPETLISALGLVKSVAAEVNFELKLLSEEKAKYIIEAAREVYERKLMAHFPLSVWQTGSGTQTNMNANEVIANRAMELASGHLSSKIHPNDDVNCSQSTNDVIPTAMHVALSLELHERLLPSLKHLVEAMAKKQEEFNSIIKMGRTHLMDALPITLGQEFSGYVEQLEQDIERIEQTRSRLYDLAIGGTAVGTGFLAPKNFGEKVAKKIAEKTKLPFKVAKNRFAALSSHDPILFLSGALSTLAASLIKITTDLSWMGSGPRSGLAELYLPENEPGSSIMPGKINPTQCEAAQMVAVHVMGSHMAVQLACSRGNFELNVFKPFIAYTMSHSIELLTDVLKTFADHFVLKIKPNRERIQEHLNRSLMLVTALREKLGYDKAAKIALKAHHENSTLKEAALALNMLSAEEFDAIVRPEKMV